MLNASLIVKNESEMLDRCLLSLKGANIYITDTGSTDNTIEIAKKYTKNVFTFPWNDSFADARNHTLSHIKDGWIISLDADEYLEEGGIEKIEKEIKNIGDFNALNIKLVWDETHYHSSPRVFKLPNKWIGDAHEYVVVNAKDTDIVIHYTKSPTHNTDPDRNQRILLKSIKKNNDERSKYYLAHDYFDRADWITALYWYEEYLETSTWRYEKADAHLRASRCLFNLMRGDKAREHCLMSILLNPNFKEALLFMADISWEKEAKVWRKFAKVADNTDVLFYR